MNPTVPHTVIDKAFRIAIQSRRGFRSMAVDGTISSFARI